LVAAATLQAGDDLEKDKFLLELFVFGKTYHTNPKCDLNETNPGVGLGVVYNYERTADFTLIGGVYEDSYENTARFLMPGLRFKFGNRNRLHANLGVNGGYFEGSDFNGFGIMPSAAVGYNRVELCFTGSPNTGREHENSTGFVATFIKVTIASW
jgi:hypothetical protein